MLQFAQREANKMSKTETVELTVLCLVHRGGELLLEEIAILQLPAEEPSPDEEAELLWE